MPVELSERELFDAIAVLGERHDDGARIARHALGWLGWEGEGPLLLRRYDVQVFTWYQLPAKFLASLEDKREVARGVALTLEQLGGQAATYARALRSHETDQLLESWELSSSIGRMLSRAAGGFRARASGHRASQLAQKRNFVGAVRRAELRAIRST